jgi:hypothetical protein
LTRIDTRGSGTFGNADTIHLLILNS